MLVFFIHSKLKFYFTGFCCLNCVSMCLCLFFFPPYDLVRIYEFKGKHSIDTNSANDFFKRFNQKLHLQMHLRVHFRSICINSVFLTLVFVAYVCNIWFTGFIYIRMHVNRFLLCSYSSLSTISHVLHAHLSQNGANNVAIVFYCCCCCCII